MIACDLLLVVIQNMSISENLSNIRENPALKDFIKNKPKFYKT